MIWDENHAKEFYFQAGWHSQRDVRLSTPLVPSHETCCSTMAVIVAKSVRQWRTTSCMLKVHCVEKS